jgi:TP901 family phage tail tape measure protein
MYHLKSLGLDNATAMSVLRASLKGAEVGLSDLEGTTNALGAAVRVGIKGTEDYSHAMALLAGITGAGNMRMDDLVAALGTGVLPTFKAVGLTLHDFGAALATMTDEAIPANEAATRLRMTVQLLAGDTPKADKQLEKIGLTGMDVAKALRGSDGLAGAIELLRDHLDRVQDPAKRFALLTKAYGARSSAGLILLINNLDVLRQKYGQIDTSASRFKQNVLEAQQSPSFKLHTSLVQLETAMTELGASVVPVIVSFTQMAAATGVFVANLGILKPLLVFLVGMYAAMKVKALASWAAQKLVNLGLKVMGPTATASAAEADVALQSMVTWEERNGAQIAILNGELRAMGPAAATGAAEAEASLASIGAAAGVAKGEVSALRAGLLGLGTIGTIGTLAVGGYFAVKGANALSGYLGKTGFGKAIGAGDSANVTGAQIREAVKQGISLDQVKAIYAMGKMTKAQYDYAVSLIRTRDARAVTPSSSAAETALKVQHGFNATKAASEFIATQDRHNPRTLKAVQLATSISIEESKASMTKTKADDKKAYADEIAFWKYLLNSFKLTGQQRAQIWQNIASAQQQIDSIDAAGVKSISDAAKKKATARKKAAEARKKAQELADQNLLPYAIQEAEAKARLTKSTKDDVAAFKLEQDFLQQRIDYTKKHVSDQERKAKILTDLYGRLADVRSNIANARKDSSNRAAAQEALAALQTRQGFMGSFAPNVYYKGTDGKLHLGAEAGPVVHKSVTVNQYGVRGESEFSPLQQARFAAEAALG